MSIMVEVDALRKLLVYSDVEDDTLKIPSVNSVTTFSLPIIDAEPIVRCKDCKHYRTRWVGFCELIGNENIHREDDDFCSYGERKTTD